MKRRAIIGLIGICALSAPSVAARQGEIVDGSKGAIAITASIAGTARLSARADAVVPGDGGLAVCLASNTATQAVTLVAAGSGDGGAFTLASDSGRVPFSVLWSDDAAHALTPGAPFTRRGTTDCVTASRLIVNASGPAGVGYAGTLSLLVAPE